MSNLIERPLFYEHQILGAADLTAAVEHGRDQQARHARYQHLWGIVEGLELTGVEKKIGDVTYQEVTLSAGVAVDGTGREIVVPEAESLDDALFDQSNVAITDPEVLYPVFLVGRDEPSPQQPLGVGACWSSEPTRTLEGYELRFGRPGDELGLDDQGESAVSEGPGDGQWLILLGFVKWSGKRFAGVQAQSKLAGRRYAGARADVVAARSGSLTLRTQTRLEAGKPALIINEAQKDKLLLQFGKLTADGAVTSLFSISENGDLTVPGKLVGALTTGGLQVESGLAGDGVILPLPPGITQAQVENGDASIQVQISPRICEDAAPDSSGIWLATPLETWVDQERRVHCRVRWLRLTGAGAPAVEDRPGVCHYLVIASVKETDRERQDAGAVRQANRPRGGCLHAQC